jgi:hypothetical protein
MAVCAQCEAEMKTSTSCLTDPVVIGNRLFVPIRWGAEPQGRPHQIIDFPCRDCNTPVGGVHHPGCCVEQCPTCGGQSLSCPCFTDPDEDEYADEEALCLHRRPHRRSCRAHRFPRRFRR